MAFEYSDANGYKNLWSADQSAYDALYAGGYEAHGDMGLKTNVDSLFNEIMNYADFSYDPAKDQLFQMYKQQYASKGKRAMQDQMGKAVAQTGGYNSSYAQTSAQNVNQQYMDELSNKAVDTYQNAFNMYQNDLNNKVNNFNIANDMYTSNRDEYYAKLNMARDKATNSYGLYQDDYKNQYGTYADQRNRDQTEKWNKKNYDLNKKALSR